MQHTLKEPVSITGKGLHTGKKVTMRVLPLEPNKGRWFIRTDLQGAPAIRVSIENRVEIPLCTALGIGESKILTVEHFLAACQSLCLDNIAIEIDGEELPSLDGSSLEFYEILRSGGVIEQKPKSVALLKDAIKIYDGEAFLIAVPSNELRISYTFVSKHINIPDMYHDFIEGRDCFKSELAPARTIAFKEQLEKLRLQGLALGGDESMVVLIDETGFANERRFLNEVARHKILDLYGDLSLIGEYRLKAHIIAVGTGHRHNALLAKEILSQLRS